MWGSDDPVRVVSDRLHAAFRGLKPHGYLCYALWAKTLPWSADYQTFEFFPHVIEFLR